MERLTNAIRRGGSFAGFTVAIQDDRGRVTTSDHQVGLPVATVPDEPTEGGYGWSLVCTLAASCAVTVTATSRTITVSLPVM